MRHINLAVQRHLMDNLLFSLFNYHTSEFVAVVPVGHGKFFQIEAGIGPVASISEMVFQDRQGLVRILPVLPGAYPEGKISELRARGGFEVDIRWSNGWLTEAKIKSLRGKWCRVKSFRHCTGAPRYEERRES